MSAEIVLRQVVIKFRWTDDCPRFQERWANKPAEWRSITATATLPLVTEDVRISGSGSYLKADGSVGKQYADMKFGHLDEIPEPHRGDILAALQEVAQ